MCLASYPLCIVGVATLYVCSFTSWSTVLRYVSLKLDKEP